jgi:hypothetical protein
MARFKIGAWSFVIGSLVTIILGFGWGGWTTTSGVDRISLDRSQTAVTAALVPVCLEKSRADRAGGKKLDALRAMTSSYEQRDAVLKDGWASVGAAEGNRDVAEACVSQLLKTAAVK